MSAMLLVELVTEELPPKALKRLGEAFAAGISAGLRTRNLLRPESAIVSYATPRRLAVTITAVLAEAPDNEVDRKLMPAKVAFDGATTTFSTALQKKLEGLGRGDLTSLDSRSGADRVYVASDGKADYVFLKSLAKGQSLAVALQEALEETLAGLPIPKLMTYQRDDGTTVKFVRPAHRLLALHGGNLLSLTALGLTARRTSSGHRFMSRPDIEIETAEGWEATLEAEGKVVPSFAKRRQQIVSGLLAASEHARVIMPDALLDEVTSLVEWPAVYAGTFDRAFLEVPQECLILTMQQNQKYFALAGDDGKLRHRFLLVSNLETLDPSAIIQGNERVLRARLSDAKFFYDQDRKQRLESRVKKLATVVYHNKLGSQLDRVHRVERVTADIAAKLSANVDEARRAARLAKADLVTDMVGEFPELQGLMGRYYALHDGEPVAVADAIAQHYWPRFAGDKLPEGPVATAVALADKMETLAGMFGIGNVPTGDKDPFGLRRAALGVLRIVIEKDLALPLHVLVDASFRAFDEVPAVQDAHTSLEEFFYERLRGYLREQGYTANQVESVLARRPRDIHLLPKQLAAVQAFMLMPEAVALAAANKRIGNILRKAEGSVAASVDGNLLVEPAERSLHAAVERLAPSVLAHVQRGDYTEALRSLASIRAEVDRFFDDVMVMADDPAVRGNRLALLNGLSTAMNQVADISKLAS